MRAILAISCLLLAACSHVQNVIEQELPDHVTVHYYAGPTSPMALPLKGPDMVQEKASVACESHGRALRLPAVNHSCIYTHFLGPCIIHAYTYECVAK